MLNGEKVQCLISRHIDRKNVDNGGVKSGATNTYQI